MVILLLGTAAFNGFLFFCLSTPAGDVEGNASLYIRQVSFLLAARLSAKDTSIQLVGSPPGINLDEYKEEPCHWGYSKPLSIDFHTKVEPRARGFWRRSAASQPAQPPVSF